MYGRFVEMHLALYRMVRYIIYPEVFGVSILLYNNRIYTFLHANPLNRIELTCYASPSSFGTSSLGTCSFRACLLDFKWSEEGTGLLGPPSSLSRPLCGNVRGTAILPGNE